MKTSLDHWGLSQTAHISRILSFLWIRSCFVAKPMVVPALRQKQRKIMLFVVPWFPVTSRLFQIHSCVSFSPRSRGNLLQHLADASCRHVGSFTCCASSASCTSGAQHQGRFHSCQRLTMPHGIGLRINRFTHPIFINFMGVENIDPYWYPAFAANRGLRKLLRWPLLSWQLVVQVGRGFCGCLEETTGSLWNNLSFASG